MQRHAEEQGVNPNQLFFKDDDAILTAEDYIDDMEEERAQRIEKEPEEPFEEDDMEDSSIEQVLQDDEGNLFI